MSKHRGRVEIIRDILSFCVTERRISYIVRSVNISHYSSQDYLQFLVDKELMDKFKREDFKSGAEEANPRSKLNPIYVDWYHTSPQGHEVLRKLNDIIEVLK